MPTPSTVLTIPLVEFTSAGVDGALANEQIFQQELAALALTAQPDRVRRSTSAVILNWDSVAIDPDVDLPLINAAVAAHVGGNLSVTVQELFLNAQQDNSTTSLVSAFDFTTAQMAGGNYMWLYSAETQLLTEGTDAAAFVDVRVDQGNGNGLTQRLTHQHNGSFVGGTPNWSAVSGFEPFTLVDGQTTRIEFRFRKVGGDANTASIRRIRGTLIRLGD